MKSWLGGRGTVQGQLNMAVEHPGMERKLCQGFLQSFAGYFGLTLGFV